ncbi:MAG: hypothetical protein K2Y22_17350 [Candidatus Obscuribacterales bacterium]|nr:hypothetical protein [Candidatus Obscuribacterales bacterium]
MRNVLVAVLVLALNWLQCPILAQEIPVDPVPDASLAAQSAAATAPDAGLNLNLSSTVASMTAPTSMTNPVNVNLGGVLTSIAPGSAVTPAQMVALHQIMRTGVQSLVLDSMGAAQGGTMTIGSHLGSMLGSLTIPSGVTVLSNAASAGAINLTGNLVNSGSFYLYSTNAATTSASVSALNIFNNQGAMLSTVLPSTLQASLPSALSSLNLNLSAINNIVNAGTIASSGNLNLYAGGSITNVGANAVMQAMQSLALTSMAGNITNAGLMAATYGNINVNAAQITNMTVNNLGGVMQALNGSINFRDQAYAGAANISLLGGDYLSKVLNLHGGQGTVDLNVGNVTGVLNAWGQCVRMTVDAPVLQLGTINATGDPYVVVTGDLNLNSVVSAPYLVAIAGQNIFTSQTNTQLITNGGNLVLAAGAVAVDASGSCANCINIDRSESGGDIFLTAGRNFGPFASQNIQAIDTSSGSGKGGNLTLIAFADYETGQTRGGHVALAPGVIVRTNGIGASANGNVTVVAEAAGGMAIGMGGINTPASSFGAGGGGIVALNVATPNAGPGGPTVDTANGNVVGLFTSNNLQNGSILVGQIVTGGAFADATHTAGTVNISTAGAINTGLINAAGAAGTGAPRNTAFNGNAQWGGNGGNGSNVTLIAGGPITTQSILSFGGGGGGGAGASANTSLVGGEGGSGGSGGNIYLGTTSTTGNTIFVTGDVNSSGGGGGGGGGGSVTDGFNLQSGPGGDGGVGGDAGTITISAPSAVSVTGGLYAVGGGEGGAGMVGAILSFDSPGGGGGGGGGSFGGPGGGGGGGSGRRRTGGSASESGKGGGSGISYDGAGFGEDGLYTTTLSFQWGGAGGGGGGYSQDFSHIPQGVGGGGGLSGGFSGVALLPPGESGFNAGGAGESGTSNAISLHVDAVSVGGVINSKNSSVEFIPYRATGVIFGGSGSTPSVLYLDSALLSNITTGVLTVGSPTYAGGIFVAAATSVPYNLTFLTDSSGGVETISGVLSTNTLAINSGYIGNALQPLLVSVPNLSARSSSGDVYIQDNTSVNLFNSGVATSGIIIDFHILVPTTGSSITIQSPIVIDGAGGKIDLSADGDIIDTSGSALQADNIILSGNHVGDVDHPIYIAAGSGNVVNLSLNSADDYIVDANPGENINIGAITSTGPVFILENGSITVSGPISTNGTVTLASILGSNGSIIVNDTITAHDKIRLTADGTGTMDINAGILSNNADIILSAANIVATSTIDAGTGAVRLIPSTNEPIVVNGLSVGPAGTFYATSSLLNAITADRVIIGLPSSQGATSLAAPLNLGLGGYEFDLAFASGGPFQANSQPIFSNGKSLTIAAGSSLDLHTVRVINGAAVFVSRGNINFVAIDTSSTVGDGGNIVAVAGADYTNDGDKITVIGSSPSGGSIVQNFGSNALRSSSTVGKGGDITLVAFATMLSALDGTGRITLHPSVTVESQGAGADSGDVMIIANGGGSAINLGSIRTAGGTAGSGNINISATDPMGWPPTPTPVDINTQTGVTSASFCCGPASFGSISINTITGVGESNVTVMAGNFLHITQVVLDGGPGQNGGHLQLAAGASGIAAPRAFIIGSFAVNGVDNISLQPGVNATQYGTVSVSNNGNINVNQLIRAETIFMVTGFSGGPAAGFIKDISDGAPGSTWLQANTIQLATFGTGLLDNHIGVSIASNGNASVRLQAISGNDNLSIRSASNVDVFITSSAGNDKVFSLTTTSGSNASIIINHDIIVSGPVGTINLTADGSGTITRPNYQGTLFAHTVNLTSSSGDLGTDASHIDMQSPDFHFSTTGSVFLDSVGPIILPVVSMSASQKFAFTTRSDVNGDASITLVSNGSNPTIQAGTVKLSHQSGNNTGFLIQQAPGTIASISAINLSLDGGSNVTITNKLDNTGVHLTFGHTNSTSNVTSIGNVYLAGSAGSGGDFTLTAKPDALGNANIGADPGVFFHMPKTNITLITTGAMSTINTNQLATSSGTGGGNLRLVTQGGDITTGDIFTDNLQQIFSGSGTPPNHAGNVEITTGTGSINGGNIVVGNIKASSYTFDSNLASFFPNGSNGKGGDVTLTSQGATSSGYIQTGTIRTEGDKGAGSVNLISEFSSVTTNAITSFNGARLIGFSGVMPGLNGGDVNLTAGTNITVNGAIDSHASYFVPGGSPVVARTNGVGGNVHLVANGSNVATGSILVTGDIITIGDLGSGNVVIESRGGNISLQNIHAENFHRIFNGVTHVVGSVTIATGTPIVNGGSIVVGSINTSSRPLTINVGDIGGDVTLSSTGNDPALGSITINGDIDTIGVNGNGKVQITTRAGNVVHAAGEIKAGLLSFDSNTGNFGSRPGLGGRAITTAISSLEFSTVGDVYINQTGDLIIDSSSASSFPFNSRVEISSTGSIFLNGFIGFAQFLTLVSGADILNTPSMSGQFTLAADYITLQAAGTIGTVSDPLRIRTFLGYTASNPNYIDEQFYSPLPLPPPPPPPLLGQSPETLQDIFESSVFANEINDVQTLGQTGASLEHQLVGNSNVNYLQGGQQVALDVQMGNSHGLANTINSANFIGDSGHDLPGNQPTTDNQALGQSFSYCDAAEFNSNSVGQMQSHGASIGSSTVGNLCVLQQGNFVFQPHADITVQVQEGSVEIPTGATVLVMETGNDVAVFDISDGPKGRVRVKSGNKIITMSPGKQVVLTRQLDADFDKINPSKLIGYKNPKSQLVADDIRAYSADFSLPSVMMSVAPMKRLLTSDSPADRKLVQRMIKNAVVLSMLPSKSGPFKTSGNSHP